MAMRASARSVLWLIVEADLSARVSRPWAPYANGTIIAAAIPIVAKPDTIPFSMMLSYSVFDLKLILFGPPSPSHRLLNELPDLSEPLCHPTLRPQMHVSHP